MQQCMWELSEETKFDSEWKEKSIEHYELYESMFKPLVLAISSLAQVSDYLQTKILLLFCSITTGQVLNDAIHCLRAIFFLLFVLTLSVSHLASLGWYVNKCHFSVVSSASFLSTFIQAFNTFSPPLFSCLFFSTSRRVLLYSFVILIDCINLLSIEFPVHHAEHNVEYYHNPSK